MLLNKTTYRLIFSILLMHITYHVSAQNLDAEIQSQLFPGTKPIEKEYTFSEKFSEKIINLSDHTKLNGVLFPANNAKGLIFYLHGSNDDISTWGKISNVYTSNNYDLFIIDYRGYGKSEGKFQSENLWYQDMQEVYDYLKKDYKEENIIILGQSLGTAAASFLGVKNNPKLVILQAPFYNMKDWSMSLDPNLDTTHLNFQLANDQHLKKIKAPVYIFHGDKDEAVNYKSSIKLQKFFKKDDKLYILKNEGHNDFSKNTDYLKYLSRILNN